MSRRVKLEFQAWSNPPVLTCNDFDLAVLAKGSNLRRFTMRQKTKAEGWTLMRSRVLLLLLSLAVGLEDFRSHFMVRFTHSHAYDAAMMHSHPEIFGPIASEMEVQPDPVGPDPKEHSHIVKLCQEVPCTEARYARLMFPPPARRHGWRDAASLIGPMRIGDPLFRPPC